MTEACVCVCVFYNFFSFIFYLAVKNHIFTVHSRLGLLVQLSRKTPPSPTPPLINITSFQSSVCGRAQRGPPASTDTGGGGGRGGGETQEHWMAAAILRRRPESNV